jgi:hypothetical protein
MVTYTPGIFRRISEQRYKHTEMESQQSNFGIGGYYPYWG